MKKTIVTLVAVAAAVVAIRRINQHTPVPRVPEFYGPRS